VAQTGRRSLPVDDGWNLHGVALGRRVFLVPHESIANAILMRAERKLGEILKRMAENGERKKQGNEVKSRGATSLSDLLIGIPKDRASRAMQLAEVPANAGCSGSSKNRHRHTKEPPMSSRTKANRVVRPANQLCAIDHAVLAAHKAGTSWKKVPAMHSEATLPAHLG
jgi:hypothetical protein